MPFKFGEDPIPQPHRQYPEDYTEDEIRIKREEAGNRYAEQFGPMPLSPDEDEETVRKVRETEEAMRKVRETLAVAPSPEPLVEDPRKD